jgi:hypothetical protein
MLAVVALSFGIVTFATGGTGTFQWPRSDCRLFSLSVGFRCGSGKLTKLTYFWLEGSFDGTIPTEM